MNIFIILIISMLIEATIQLVKPIWSDAMIGNLSLTELISMIIGVAIAIIGKLNLLADMVQVSNVFLLYVFYICTGLAMGRGASFVHDLWLKLRSNYGDVLLTAGIIETKNLDGDEKQ